MRGSLGVATQREGRRACPGAARGGRLPIGDERGAEAPRARAAAATALTAAAAAAVATSAEVAEPRLRTGRFSERWKTGESPP
jgi:hypothetical protein